MKIITLDFETFWDTDYSLSKMTPLEYITDPRFEVQFCEMCIDGEEPEFLVGFDAMKARFAQIDWSKVAALGHNMSGFDALLMAIVFGIVPAMWLCTLAMARPIYAKTIGLSLKKLVEELLEGEAKDNTVLLQTKGKRLADFSEDEIRRMKIYNGADTRQCRKIFAILRKHFTVEELWQIDCLIRMRTEPEFVVDVPLLQDALEKVRAEKLASLNRLIEALGLSLDTTAEQVRAQLASAPKFAALLQSLGVEVPTKASKTNPDKFIPALAKTDEQFIELVEHPNELVATAARCRLEVKSTGLEARIEAHLNAAARSGGKLPIPIKYCGADTSGRDSGEEYNPQNQPRINKKKPKLSDCVRRSLRAPEGHVVAVADQSGIELRVSHFLWKVPQSMEAYHADVKADLYRSFAARYYGVPEDQIESPQRQFGKVAQLQLQFGAGHETFRSVASVQYGVDLPMHFAHLDGRKATAMNARQALALTLDGFKQFKDEAKDGVYGWRDDYVPIVDGWGRCNDALARIAKGQTTEIDPWGLVKTCSEGFVLPSGRLIRYPHLRFLDDVGVIEEFFNGERPDDYESVKKRTGWWYGRGRHRARIYGGKADENVVQALARDSIFDCAVVFYRLTGYRPKLRVHDELVYIFPENKAQQLLTLLQKIIRTPPKWWPELVVWSEGDLASCYGDAK